MRVVSCLCRVCVSCVSCVVTWPGSGKGKGSSVRTLFDDGLEELGHIGLGGGAVLDGPSLARGGVEGDVVQLLIRRVQRNEQVEELYMYLHNKFKNI